MSIINEFKYNNIGLERNNTLYIEYKGFPDFSIVK